MNQRQDRTDIQLKRERCYLVAAIIPGRYTPYEDPLDELACLVDTAGGMDVGRMTQRMDRPHPRTFLGKGKFADLADAVVEARADTIVVDDNLSPNQIGALEEACRRKVIDRDEVILDIFCSRAHSHQAKLQVELAQLQYELPRLTRKWTHLERLGGGLGTRGPGESQIETDRRLIRAKITHLRRELDKIEQRKIREVQARSGAFTVSLVGYTNAGKSSLLNAISGADAFVEDRLFATLDTLTRKVELEDGLMVPVSDTVGFIRRLPHHLVASFHATLEEAAQANLLLHVIDGSDPLATAHIVSVERTLTELGMQDKERVYIFNKLDVCDDRAGLAGMAERFQPSLVLSAHTGEGIDDLREFLHQKANASKTKVTLRFPAADGRRFALINEHAQVRDIRYEDADVIITAIFERSDLERIKSLPGTMETVE